MTSPESRTRTRWAPVIGAVLLLLFQGTLLMVREYGPDPTTAPYHDPDLDLFVSQVMALGRSSLEPQSQLAQRRLAFEILAEAGAQPMGFETVGAPWDTAIGRLRPPVERLHFTVERREIQKVFAGLEHLDWDVIRWSMEPWDRRISVELDFISCGPLDQAAFFRRLSDFYPGANLGSAVATTSPYFPTGIDRFFPREGEPEPRPVAAKAPEIASAKDSLIDPIPSTQPDLPPGWTVIGKVQAPGTDPEYWLRNESNGALRLWVRGDREWK